MGLGEATRAAHSPWVGLVGRLGHAARGALYAVVAVLAIEVALGIRRRTPDREGALATIAEQPFGRVLLFGLAIGLAGFAVWRLAQGVFARKKEGGGKPSPWKRVGYVALGLFYAATTALALSFVVGRGSSGTNEHEQTARVLDWPLGRYAIGAIGAGFVIAGVVNLYLSLTEKFRKRLREEELGKKARAWMIGLGIVGHVARAVVFSLVGTFLLKAAIEFDPGEALGLDGALAKVAKQPFGGVLLAAVAGGLLAYAAFCFVLARHADA